MPCWCLHGNVVHEPKTFFCTSTKLLQAVRSFCQCVYSLSLEFQRCIFQKKIFAFGDLEKSSRPQNLFLNTRRTSGSAPKRILSDSSKIRARSTTSSSFWKTNMLLKRHFHFPLNDFCTVFRRNFYQIYIKSSLCKKYCSFCNKKLF